MLRAVVGWVLILELAGAGQSPPSPGLPDRSFGIRGHVVTDLGGLADEAFSVAVQSNGKTIVAGQSRGDRHADFAVVRYRRDGSLDSAFGKEGKVTTDFARGFDSANDVALSPDGTIVVGGTATSANHHRFPGVVRYLPSGERDRSFSGDGRRLLHLSGDEPRGAAIALQNDGKVVIAGNSPPAQVFAIRMNPDGTRDPTFGENGAVVTELPDTFEPWTIGLIELPDGRILVGAQTLDAQKSQARTALVRYLPNGDLDPSFGQGGIMIRKNDFTLSVDMALQPDGRILVVGRCQCGSQIYVDRYLPNGSIDTSFGQDGTVAPHKAVDPHAIALQPNGKIIIAGDNLVKEVLVRLTPDGTVDAAFGRHEGWEREPFPSGRSGQVGDATLTKDDRLVIAASVVWEAEIADGKFIVSRYVL